MILMILLKIPTTETNECLIYGNKVAMLYCDDTDISWNNLMVDTLTVPYDIVSRQICYIF